MKLQLSHRTELQRELLRGRYNRTQRHEQPRRQSPFAASREHHTRLGFNVRAWLPEPQQQIYSRNGNPVSLLQGTEFREVVSNSDSQGEVGLLANPLQEPPLPDVRQNLDDSSIYGGSDSESE